MLGEDCKALVVASIPGYALFYVLLDSGRQPKSWYLLPRYNPGFCKREALSIELQQHNAPRLDYSITLHLGDVLRDCLKCLFSLLQANRPGGSMLVYSMTQCIRGMLPLPADLTIGGFGSPKSELLFSSQGIPSFSWG